jgi:SAM-dependent methyltransferase
VDSPVQTWHYGLVARWWAEFNHDGPEIPYFRRMIERFGQPALDIACGTGRLLLPYLRDGLDVDGSDVSEDMLGYCRGQSEREGLTPQLFAQAMHALDLPRTYRTAYICGGFGLGGIRQNDVETLRRVYELLEPGGALILDNYLPYKGGDGWEYWTKKGRAALPAPWPDPYPPRETSDGSALRVRARVAELDPLEQVITLEMWAEELRDGNLTREETSFLKSCLYFRNELVMMLRQAGFRHVEVEPGYEERAETEDDEILVFIAIK